MKHDFTSAMDDDLNISSALTSLFKIIKRVNVLTQEMRLDPKGASKIRDAFRGIDSVLHIFDFEDALHDPQIQRLIKEREQARVDKDWSLADNIRNQLQAKGITVKDQKKS